MNEGIPQGRIERTERLERQEGDISPDFFDLQLKFADIVREKSGLPQQEALANYTCFRLRFFYGVSPELLESAKKAWSDYMTTLEKTNDKLDLTYQTYLKTRPFRNTIRNTGEDSFGCFDFDYFKESGDVHIHFSNEDAVDAGPLSKQKMPQRLAELTRMFSNIKVHHPEAKRVHGESWLYNRPEYCRLFPESYTAHPVTVTGGGFEYGRRWGQFLTSEGELHKDLAEQLLKNAREKPMEHLAEAFPLPTLTVEGPIEDFYKKYGI